MDSEMRKKLIVEFIGPFALTFMGAGAIIQTGGNDLVAIALAHGLAIGLLVLAAGHISGGHFNPAVTVSMWVTKRIESRDAIGYIIAQLAGALAAAGALTLCYPDVQRNAVNLGLPAVGKGFSSGNAVFAEVVLTFFLVFVIFGTAVDSRTPKIISGLAIGLTITMDVLMGGQISGAAMNPSRWFGTAVVQGDFSNFWVWIVGPIVGGVIAAVLYNELLMDGGLFIGRAAAVEVDEIVVETSTEPPVRRSRRAQRRGH
jgi:aquaporin TIP